MNKSLSLADKVSALRNRTQSETGRLASIVLETENETPLPHLAEACCFAGGLCLDVRESLDKARAQLREIEVSLENGGPDNRRSKKGDTSRLEAIAAVVEWRLNTVTETLNKARLTMDGVIDIWGKKLPSGGLWDK